MAFDLATARPAEEVEQPAAAPPPPQPKPRFDVATAKPVSYMDDYLGGIKDAATAPGGGPTGIGLVDAAAGVADFAASAAVDALGAPLRLGTHAFAAARGSKKPYDPEAFTRKPTTPVGSAIQNTLGAALRPVGDVLNATGVDPNVAAAGMDLVGTAADVIGLGAGVRGAKAGVKAVRPDIPDPGGPLRPFGPQVEQARRLNYRVMPSQVDAKAQIEAPLGSTGVAPPGTIRQTFAGPTLKDRFTIDNQKRTNIFAAKDLGISEITEQGLELAKYPHNAVFNEVARTVPYIRRDAGLEEAANLLGGARRDNPLLRQTREVELIRDRLLSAETMTTQQVLDAIRELRKDARIAFQKVGDVEAEQAATAYRGAADALEEALERQAGAVDPTLIPRLKDARTALAKIHNVQDAFDGTNVDALALAKLAKKYPLTGYLAEIAQVATNFPDTMRSATGLTIKEPSNQSVLMSINLAGRRAAGREQVPTLMSDEFQTRYGAADPNYDPRPAPTPPPRPAFSEYQPPGPDDLPPPGSTMPPAPGGGPGLTATGLADDFDTLPPAEARPGDLTAETPPMGGSLPAGLLDELIDAPDLGLEPPMPPRTPDTIDFANDPELAALFAGDDPLRQNVPQAPGGDALDLGAELTPPLSDLELLDLQLQAAAPPGSLGPVRPRPLPPDDLAGELVEPQGPPPVPPAPLELTDELTSEPPPVLDLAEARGPRSQVPEGRQVEGTKLEVRDNAPPDMIDDHLFPRGATVIHEGPANKPTRWVVMSKNGDRMQIDYINNEKGPKGGAQDLYVRAAREAEARGLALDGGAEVKRGAYMALKRAVEKGLVTVDNWPEAEAAFKAAFERDPAQAVNKSGESFAKGIRVGPAG